MRIIPTLLLLLLLLVLEGRRCLRMWLGLPRAGRCQALLGAEDGVTGPLGVGPRERPGAVVSCSWTVRVDRASAKDGHGAGGDTGTSAGGGERAGALGLLGHEAGELVLLQCQLLGWLGVRSS